MCERFGFDAAAIAARVRLVELGGADNRRLGELLQQQVIAPRADHIVACLIRALQRIEQFDALIRDHSELDKLAALQMRYLSGFGLGIDSFEYFEQRLRIGYVHHRIGVPQSVYQSSYRSLEYEIIRNIPDTLRADRASFDSLVEYVLKVIALDMSLAVESYCKSQTCNLEDTLQNERGETERLRQIAITDWLTDLHNHAYSRHLLLDKLAESKVNKTPLSIIMADLDQFKQINDTHGHLVGDHVLRIAAARMVAAARSGDEIGRYGGEEFLFLLENTDLAAARNVAERVRKRIAGDAIRHEHTAIRVSLSLGIAQARDDDSVDELIGRADAALYAAKLAGRNCVKLEKGE
jgi:diguanylate cyclase (GGDEF)-like protein